MSNLSERHCKPCEGGGVPAHSMESARAMMQQLHKDWRLEEADKSIRREFKFKNFYRTMSFVNAVAHIANVEGHHPDLEVGYNYCRMKWTTHALGGLSDNDFICAAKVDALPVG
ncbi:MAG TPA: 4a-hydroxytetrahydrobiopterin dehydratase [Steroidobacteraceae bacterium]|nr:4a-hydroxytetrahydrobiopterin dehydratase [Steroidobacteraceae bacterium]